MPWVYLVIAGIQQLTKIRDGFWLVASKEEKADGHQAFRRGSFFPTIA